MISLNAKIYARQQKYIANPPEDLKLFQIAPEGELQCGVISSSMEHIRSDYRYGLEMGLDALPKLKTLVVNLPN